MSKHILKTDTVLVDWRGTRVNGKMPEITVRAGATVNLRRYDGPVWVAWVRRKGRTWSMARNAQGRPVSNVYYHGLVLPWGRMTKDSLHPEGF